MKRQSKIMQLKNSWLKKYFREVLGSWGFSGGAYGKKSACNVGDQGSVPESGRYPGEGTGYPLQYSCLENSTVRGACWAIVHGVRNTFCTFSLSGKILLHFFTTRKKIYVIFWVLLYLSVFKICVLL